MSHRNGNGRPLEKRRRRSWIVTGLIAVGAFVVGWLSRGPADPAPKAAAAVSPATLKPARQGRVAAASTPPRLANDLVSNNGDPEADRRARAERTFQLLLRRLEFQTVPPGITALEIRPNMMRDYVIGLLEGFQVGDARLESALAQEFQRHLCEQNPTREQAILLAYVAQGVPEIATPRALDCFFGRSAGTEDAALWYMMDAWRLSGQPRTPALEILAHTARDQRTKRRFMSREQEILLRSRGRPLE
jgi:hypothetical protein